MNYDLSKLKLLAQGGEADIYEFDEKRILRVLRRQKPDGFKTEEALFKLLQNSGVQIPKVYECGNLANAPYEVMERIPGKSMLDTMIKNPFKAKLYIGRLAELHEEILSVPCEGESDIPTLWGQLAWIMQQPLQLEKTLLDFAYHLLQSLPEANKLCHGDFHPGNILGRECFIIDWSGARIGNPISDIAHTYLLLRHVPVIPGMSFLKHQMMCVAGKYIAKEYLHEMKNRMKLDMTEFSKWTVVMSMFRVYHGLASEKENRTQYIRNCVAAEQKNISPSKWYRMVR